MSKKLCLIVMMIMMSLSLMGCDPQYEIEELQYKLEDLKWEFDEWLDGIRNGDEDEYYDEYDEYEEDEEVPFGEIDWETGEERYDEFSVTPLPSIDYDTEIEEEQYDMTEEEPYEEEYIDGMTDYSLDDTLSKERYFAYNTLETDEERDVYKLIYMTLVNFDEKTKMPTTDSELVDRVFACVLADNPEFFYVRGYNLVRYERGGELKQLAVSGLYTMTPENVTKHREKVDEYARECLAGMPKGGDDYSKIKYLYEYIIKNTDYDLNAENGQNFLSVFETGKSVCQGYATAMQYLLTKSGIMCTVVRGVTKNENHAWNLVKADGDFYYVDPTWGDTSYDVTVDKSMSQAPSVPEVSYEYLCITTKQLEKTHTISNYFPVPECTATADYYFLREGNYFKEVDKNQLHSVFEKAYANNTGSAIIKCADEKVYADMMDYLTTQGKVFDYLKDTKNVNYITLDSVNELIFYL